MARARSLSEFQTSFPDETSCAAFLFERRWSQGFVCPACGGGRAALLKSRAHTYECLDCGHQTSITAGTAMHRSKLPLTVRFWARRLAWTISARAGKNLFRLSTLQICTSMRRRPACPMAAPSSCGRTASSGSALPRQRDDNGRFALAQSDVSEGRIREHKRQGASGPSLRLLLLTSHSSQPASS
jgi:predicted RNA-binding Zn-ribbon protein involved in translation (DUF1610 family)